MEQPAQSLILGLADELLIQIVQHVDSKQDLCNLAIACSRLQTFAEPAMYNSILLRKGSQALILFVAIAYGPRGPPRALFIRKLQIRYIYDDGESMEIMNLVLKHLSNLKELLIEAPCCNDSHAQRPGYESREKIDYAAWFEFASSMTLGSQPRVQVPLETLILHSHNSGTRREAFNMGKNAVIFRHLTLRNITISCFDIGQDVEPYLSASKNSTVLKSLTFDECNITIEGLGAILSVPKALEKLTIGERMNHLSSHEPLGRYPGKFLKALALQERSLQYIKHIGGNTNLPFSPTNLSMATFSNMREMELDTCSILTRILEETAPPWTPTIPPNLHLRLLMPVNQNRFDDEDDVWDAPLQSMIGWIGRVANLDVVVEFGYARNMDEVIRNLWESNVGVKLMQQILSLLGPGRKKAGQDERRLRIFIFRGSGYIPPYMYGEELPTEELLFDSDTYGSRVEVSPVKGLEESLAESLEGNLEESLKESLEGHEGSGV